MIRIKRENSDFIVEEFINENDIHRCWKKKVIDEAETYDCSPCAGMIIPPDNFKKITGGWSYGVTTYVDECGNKFAFVEDNAVPRNFWDDSYREKRWNGKTLWPGWNKVEIIPEKYHYTYFIEINRQTRNNYDKGTEVVEINEESYNRIINHD